RRSTGHDWRAPLARQSWDFEVYQWSVLLPAEHIGIVDVSRDHRARYRNLNGARRIVVEDRHHARFEPVSGSEPLRVDDLRVAYLLVGRPVLEDHIERELERPRVLAAYQFGDLPELGHCLGSNRCSHL